MTITVHGLRKSYGRVRAVDDIDLEVPTGSLFAFLGTNGAGKSTTISCLTTVLRPDAGEVVIDDLRLGRDDDRIRRAIGVVFQDSLLDPLLSVRENLVNRARLYGLGAAEIAERVERLSALIELDDYLDRRYARLSGGQRRRADIARSLVHDPRVLFLDEPTTGLDPQSREQVWVAIDSLRDAGTTVFLTTHYMAETERADDVCIIDDGRIVARGTPAELRRAHSSSILSLSSDAPDALVADLRAHGEDASRDGDLVLVKVPSSAAARAVLDRLGAVVTDFEFRHGTMDDVFLDLTRKQVEP